jgi:PAS domain S-box-containing protein
MIDHSSAVPMWCSESETGLIVDANDAALRFWGYARESFIGMPATRLLCDDELKRQRKLTRTAIRGVTGPWKCRRADGSIVIVTVRWERTTKRDKSHDMVTLHSAGDRAETLTRVVDTSAKGSKRSPLQHAV